MDKFILSQSQEPKVKFPGQNSSWNVTKITSIKVVKNYCLHYNFIAVGPAWLDNVQLCENDCLHYNCIAVGSACLDNSPIV